MSWEWLGSVHEGGPWHPKPSRDLALLPRASVSPFWVGRPFSPGAESDSPLHPPRLKSDSSLTLGDVTSLNMTMLEGGVSFNVVPSEMAASFDIRIPPTVDLKVSTTPAPPRGAEG